MNNSYKATAEKDFLRIYKAVFQAGGESNLTYRDIGNIALALRLGIGSVFVIGGWWKLSRALDPERAGALVERYTAPNGYINAFFQDYLFTNDLLSPWLFLTVLSSLELVAGIALIAGFLVRPFAILFGLMMWAFVAALPTLTVPGIEDGADALKTYFTPAMIVQIRDIGLSGMCAVLAMLGSGRFSLDGNLMRRGQCNSNLSWAFSALILRLSIAVVFIAGGAFFGLDHVKSWSSMPLLLIVVGVALASGHYTRFAAGIAFSVLVIYCLSAVNLDRTLWDNLNAVKREFAFIAASFVLMVYPGSTQTQLLRLFERPGTVLFGEVKST